MARDARHPGERRLAIGVPLRDAHLGSGPRRRLLRDPTGAGVLTDTPRPVDRHVHRLQRLGRTVAVHGRNPCVLRTPAGPGLPFETGAGRSEGAGPARPRGAGVLHVGRGTRLVPLERRFGVVDVGTAVRRMGRTRGLRDRRRHLAGPRAPSRGPGWPSTLPLGGARRVLVLGDARCGRGLHLRRWQRRVLRREHVLVAGPLRRRHDGVLQVPSRRRPGRRLGWTTPPHRDPGRIGGSGGRSPR